MDQNKEGATTLTFAGVALVACLLAWWFSPSAITNDRDLEGDIVGKPVFASFEDPTQASTFEIIKFDEDLARLDRFEVARDEKTDLWRLPSHDDYPADAAEQVRDATTPLASLNVLGIQSFDPGDHELYGVVNPDDEDLSVAGSGVGMLVRVTDSKKQVMASLIVGKEVEKVEGQRYVRVPTEDAVYVVELDTTPFTTDFKKWIKGKLLDVRGFDITGIDLRNYVLFPTPDGRQMQIQKNFDADVAFDAASSKWALERFVTYNGPIPADTELAAGEKLNDTALNALRNSIQDLEIDGVFRKPNGLAFDLKADQTLLNNKESILSLNDRGFFPQPGPDGVEVFAAGGETLVSTKDGVTYLMRFGNSDSRLSDDADQDPEATTETGLSRYLMVTAALDKSQFPLPELKSVPQSIEEMLALEQAPVGTPTLPVDVAPVTVPTDLIPENNAPGEAIPPVEPETSQAPDAQPIAPPVVQPPSPGLPTTAPVGEEASQPNASSEPEVPAVENPATPGVEAEPKAIEPTDLDDCNPATASQDAQDDKQPAGITTSETEATQDAASTAQSDIAPSTPAAPQPQATTPEAQSQEPAAKPAATQEELQERLELMQEEIARENQRLMDEHKEKVDSALKRVQELNARFADWYYVVNDSVYKKLMLNRDQLITTGDDEAASPALPNAPGGLPPNFQFPGQ